MVEPAYYWRVQRDYDIPNISAGEETGTIVPEPIIVSFVHDVPLTFIEETLASFSSDDLPRLVIHMLPPTTHTKYNHQQRVYVSKTLLKLSNFREPTKTERFVLAEQKSQGLWASHSVGKFDQWHVEEEKYQGLPSLASVFAAEQAEKLRNPQANMSSKRIRARVRKTSGSSSDGVGREGEGEGERERERGLTNRYLSSDVERHTRLCANLAERMRGNRSCFGKCS